MKQHLDSTSLFLHNMVGALAFRIGECEPIEDLIAGEITDRICEDHLGDLLTVRHHGENRILLEYALDAVDTYAHYICVHTSSHPDDWLIEDCIITGSRLRSGDTLYNSEATTYDWYAGADPDTY